MQIYADTHQGCGYKNEARLRRLKLLKPAKAGFVCVATPFRVSATKLTCSHNISIKQTDYIKETFPREKYRAVTPRL